jgi:integrative and conjugative element protein (TIGR02256 family)
VTGQKDLWFELAKPQSLCVTSNALRTMHAYRQTLPWKLEAGGQLFGTVSQNEVIVHKASKPHRRDDRGRYHFRSHPDTARRAIADAHAMGYLFLGEWHTHAEGVPRPSYSDLDAVRQIFGRSTLNVSRLVLLIRGTVGLPAGLGAFLLGQDAPGELRLTLEKLRVMADR